MAATNTVSLLQTLRDRGYSGNQHTTAAAHALEQLLVTNKQPDELVSHDTTQLCHLTAKLQAMAVDHVNQYAASVAAARKVCTTGAASPPTCV